MNNIESEKVKEIKRKLEEEIFIANSFGDKLRKVPTKELENLLTLINELESENETKTHTIADLLKKQEFYETEKLKQFAERLKEKTKNLKLGSVEIHNFVWVIDIDETLKEFI